MKQENSTRYPVMETFYSIQGEAFHTGKPAWFVRLSGCDVGCHWCDVKESWDVENSTWIEAEEIAENIKIAGAPIVIVTGGEPTMYNLYNLTKAIQSAGIRTHIETSGVHPISGDWDWICFSPKKFKKPLDRIYEVANELKIIVSNKHDLKWAEEHAEQLNDKCKLYLQPEWSKRDSLVPIILNYVRENPKWSLSLQTHKYIGVP